MLAGQNFQDRRVAHALDCLRAAQDGLPPSLQEIAAQVNLSPLHLNRLLKHFTGRSFKTHVRAVREARAVHLLENTFLSIKEISTCLGFARTSHFDREFRRAHGVTPTEWRRGGNRSQQSPQGVNVPESSTPSEQIS